MVKAEANTRRLNYAPFCVFMTQNSHIFSFVHIFLKQWGNIWTADENVINII